MKNRFAAMSERVSQIMTAILCATAFAAAPCVNAMSVDSSAGKTFVSQFCGTGQSFTITIDRKGDGDNGPKHHPTACHVMCTESEEMEEA